MITPPNCASLLRILMRAWVVAWMLVVPFIHIHPEADQHHGEAGHVHGGMIHTVFSQDLDGEFGIHYELTGSVKRHIPNQVALAGHPEHGSELSEIGFSVLHDPAERKLSKPTSTHGLIAQSATMCVVPLFSSLTATIVVPSPDSLLTRAVPSRAPPSVPV